MDALKALLASIIVLSLVFVPLGGVLVVLLLAKRKERRDSRRSPLNDELLHQAGAQAR